MTGIKSIAGATAIGLALTGAATADTYGYSSNGLSFPFGAAIVKGFTEAAKAAGVDVVVLDSQGDVLKQTNDIDDLIAQGVQAIGIAPQDSAVATAWADKVAAAGIPAVAISSMIGDPHTRRIDDVYPSLAALVTQDEVEAGRAAGLLAAKLLEEKGIADAKVAIIEGAAGYAEVTQRTEGFEASMKEAGQAYEVVASQLGDWTAEKGEAACQNILSSNPDVDLFFNQADDMVVGCARAVEAAGSGASLIGVGGSKLAIQAIGDGSVDGTVCYKPEEIGRLSFAVLHDVVTGAKAHEAEFVAYPTPGVTKANVAECTGQW